LTYYKPENLKKIPQLVKKSPEAANAYFHFEKTVFEKETILLKKTKELIAIVVAHVSGCPYCIDVHINKYKALGGTMEEVTEAILVAASTRAGAILAHGVNSLIAFEEGN